MKRCTVALIGYLMTGACFAQEIVLEPGKSATLHDRRTGNTYTLDTSHIYITATDSKGKQLWTSYTTECSFCRNCHPQALDRLELRRRDPSWPSRNSKDEYILFATQCICQGYFDLGTGKYELLGCD